MALNKDQQIVQDKILDAIERELGGIILIKGEAGTGKSYTVAESLNKSNLNILQVAVSAPTDAAKDVIAASLPQYDARTTHSILGYYPSPDEEGKQWLNAMLERVIPYSVVVVDEVFCCPNVMIQAMWERRDILWICLGDPGQLKAIGDTFSILDEMDLLFSCELKIQERSRATCFSIIQSIRDYGTDYKPDFVKSNVFYERFYSSLEKEESAVFIAYHNRTVNEVAKQVRLRLYEVSTDKPIVGEKLRMKLLMNDEGKKLIHSNAIVKVTEVYDHGFVARYKDTFTYCPYLIFNSNGVSVVEEARLEALGTFGKRERIRAWQNYYNLENSFAKWGSPYASTAHSFQGSTCDKVFIDYGDILMCRTDPNILYSAASRARDYVYFKK